MYRHRFSTTLDFKNLFLGDIVIEKSFFWYPYLKNEETTNLPPLPELKEFFDSNVELLRYFFLETPLQIIFKASLIVCKSVKRVNFNLLR